jgi:hypothetical protein
MQMTHDDDGFKAALMRFNTRVQEKEKETLYANTDRLMSEPLIYTTDAARLAELEKRFSGGTFFLNTAKAIIRVKSVEQFIHVLGSSFHYSAFADIPGATYTSGRPKLVVDYKGQYIDLAHLWV